MSIAAFESSIESELLKGLVRHWAAVRGERRMPGWDDIRPSALRAQLPIIWSWRFDRGRGVFVGRLAGERIQSVFGANVRGADMSEIFSGRDYENMLTRHLRVMTGPAFFRGSGLVFHHLDRFDMGERIILPLADDGVAGDGIIGATLTQTSHGTPQAAARALGEIEEWFDVD